MIGVNVISKQLLVPNYPWNSHFSGMINLCIDDFLPMKVVMLARSEEEQLAVFSYSFICIYFYINLEEKILYFAPNI